MGKRKQRRLKNKKKIIKAVEVKEETVSYGWLSFFDKNYKKLMIIPFVVLMLAFLQIGMQYMQTGDFMIKSIGLKGGVSITIPDADSKVDIAKLEDVFSRIYPDTEFTVRELSSSLGRSAVVVEAGITDKDEVADAVSVIAKSVGMKPDDLAINVVGASLGNSFFHQTLVAVLAAFVMMGIVVLILFRSFVPSAAVIISAMSDIVVTLAVVNLMGMRITSAGIAAFLMLIGYSIDTDILLTTRVLKGKKGTIFSRIVGAAKTGLTMNMSTIAAVLVGIFLSQSEVLSQIMIIMFIGLVVDIMNTWIQNVGILRWYLEK